MTPNPTRERLRRTAPVPKPTPDGVERKWHCLDCGRVYRSPERAPDHRCPRCREPTVREAYLAAMAGILSKTR